MNTLTKILGRFGVLDDIRAQLTDNVKRKAQNGRYLGALQRQRSYNFNAGLDEFRQALILAEDPTYPNRKVLYDIYNQLRRDGQVYSQTELRILKTVGEPFVILGENGEPDEQAAKIMRRTWFEKYIRYCIESRFWGHSLIEFQEPIETADFSSEVSSVKLFPREHVRPESGEILINPHEKDGIPYRDDRTISRWLMEFGEHDDLGIFQVVAQDFILKKYSRTDWAKHSEKYGAPFLWIKTSSTQRDDLDSLETMAANFGNNGYMISGIEDEGELLESNRTSAHEMYSESAKYSDEQISKAINMQVAASDEKAFVGAAEVQERQLNEVIEYDMRSIKNHFNLQLKDFLIRNYNYTFLQGKSFEWERQMREQKLKEAMDEQRLNPQPDPNQPGQQQNTPRQPGANFNPATAKAEAVAMHQAISNLYGDTCCTHDPEAKEGDGIQYTDALVQRLTQKVWDKVIRSGDIDKDLFERLFDEMWQEVKTGYGKRITREDLPAPEVAYIRQLRQNVNSFAAFKNYQHIRELAINLVDENGVARTFQQFEKIARNLNEQYNINWLRAEFNHARASARMAGKWARFDNRKDVLPNLVYKSVRDGRVREEHRQLDGSTYPIDHPFWDNYMPPNGWNCRCIVSQTDGPVKIAEEQPVLDPLFRQNAAKAGAIFPDNHPYFQGASYDIQKVRKQIDEMA